MNKKIFFKYLGCIDYKWLVGLPETQHYIFGPILNSGYGPCINPPDTIIVK